MTDGGGAEAMTLREIELSNQVEALKIENARLRLIVLNEATQAVKDMLACQRVAT